MANQFEVVHLMNKLHITEQEALELIKFDKQSEALQKAKLEEMGVNTPALSKATVQTKSTAPKTKASTGPASNSKSKNENSVSKTKIQKSSSKSKNEKENLIAEMNSFVAGLDVSGIQNLKSTSVTFKGADGNYYTIALTAHKAAPTGYKE
jgi:hypothetical protein